MNRLKESVSIYSPHADVHDIGRYIQQALPNQIVSFSNYTTHMELYLVNDCYIQIYQINNASSKSMFQTQIQRLYQALENRKCSNIFVKQNLLYQITMFQSAYVFVFDMYMENRDEIILPFMEIAEYLDAILFWESDEISNSYGELLLDRYGNSEVDTFFPMDGYLKRNTLSALTNRMYQQLITSTTFLQAQGIYAPSKLLPVNEDKIYVHQSIEEIAKRIIACVCLGVYSDCVIQQNYNGSLAYEKTKYLLDMFQAIPYFTNDEIEYLNKIYPSKKEVAYYQYAYESAYTLMWMLQLINEFQLIKAVQLSNSLVECLFQFGTLTNIVEKAVFRNQCEILNQMDITQRYLWACIDMEKKKFIIPYGMNKYQMEARLKSFRWIIYEYNSSWDHVDLTLYMM